MNKIISTKSGNNLALIARLALGFTIFPHGAQKLLGWFGGYGYSASMNYFTEQEHLPYLLGLLFILIEFFGALFLIAGFLSRIFALGFLVIYLGALVKVHAANGFFMNWASEANKGEGWEYLLLLFGLTIIVMIGGGGKFSIDSNLTSKNYQDGK